MPQEQRVTMADVARTAGVSLMTVSRSLKGHPSISLATRQRVQELAREMGYCPDPAVSQLMSRLRLSRTAAPEPIAWLTSAGTRAGWRHNPSEAALHAGASRRAEQLGYRLDEFWLKEPGMSEERISHILHNRGIRGLIVAPMHLPGATLSRMRWEFFAAATCGYSLARPVLHRACSHQFHAIRVAWETLINRNYKRIGLALSSEANERIDGLWLGSLLVLQRKIPTRDRIPPLIDSAWNSSSLLKWFNKHHPDVVISNGATRNWLARAAIQIPGDCGFALLNTFKKGEAGVNHHMEDVGRAAADLVIEQLNANEFGVPAVPKIVEIECSWSDGTAIRTRI